jgi:cell division protein ZapA
MSNVTLTVGSRSYTVACAEGEEAHITRLGAVIDSKLASMGDMAGQSEGRSLLFAALLLADELHEAKRQPAPATSAAPDPTLATRLSQIADSLENIATRLEN